MKRKYVKVLIVIVVLIIGGLFIYQNINKENKPLPEVKLKEIVNKDKTMAIMIQSENGYKEYDSNTWPDSSYKFKEAKCIDNSGDEVKEAVTYEEGKITLTTNKTIYCTVYFDYKGTINILRENDTQKYLSEDLPGGMYRYQIAPVDENEAAQMSNWICFGTKENCGTNEDNVDKYMYRIIGVTKEGQLYLIKETFLKEGETTGFSWNDKNYVDSSSLVYCDNGLCPEWNTSLLFKRINGTSNGTQKGNGLILDKEWTDIFIDSSEYDYLKSGDSNSDGKASYWYNLIADHEWMYGDTLEWNSTNAYTGDYMYRVETGNARITHFVGTKDNITQETYTWSEKVKAKISLMYIHDYVYSYYDGSTEESRGNPKNYDTAKNGWLFFQKDGYNTAVNYEWLSTRWGVHGTDVPYVDGRNVGANGLVNGYSLRNEYGVRPVFYLNSNIKITDGDGTKTNPYIINIEI